MGREIPDNVNLPPIFGGHGKGKKGGGSGGKQSGKIGGLVVLVVALALGLVGTPVVYLVWHAVV